MIRILVSACLLGERVRYDGRDNPCNDARLRAWQHQGRLVPLCPEVAGGLPVPRPRAEIQRGAGGCERVVTVAGDDVSMQFAAGARAALRLARHHGAQLAVLTDRSPSCGSHEIHDGSFSGRRLAGQGVTARLLEQSGVRVFSQHHIDEAAAWLATLQRRQSGERESGEGGDGEANRDLL